MRILHIVHQLPPDYVGGTELYTQSLAQAQARLGHQVAMAAPTPDTTGNLIEESIENGITVFRLPVGLRSGTAVFRDTFGDQFLERAMGEVFDSFRPDIVHVQHLMGLPLGSVRLLQERNFPFVLNLHDYWYRCANAQLLTNYDLTVCHGPDKWANNCGRCALARAGLPGAALLAPVIAPIMRRRNALLRDVYAAAAVVIAPNDFVRATYAALDMPVDRLTVLPWGQDLPANLPAIRQSADAERQTRSPGPMRLGYIGGLSYQKGIHVLVEAVNKLPDDSVTLDIYGNPEAFPEYVAEVTGLATHPGIRIRGTLARAEFWSHLAALDALVLPTLWYEASPLTIDEAFAAGTPVLGADIGALPAMIRDNADGRLFAPGDVEGLAGLLRSLQQDPAQLDRLRSGIRPVKTMDSHALEMISLYEQSAESKLRKR